MDAPENKPTYFSGFLQGTFNHYSAEIPLTPVWLLGWLMRRLFAHLDIAEADQRLIRQAAEKGVIVYALPNASRLEYLYLTIRLRLLGLPAPVFGHYISVYMVQPVMKTLRRIVAVLVSLLTRHRYPSPYRDGLVERMIEAGQPSCLFLRQFRGLPRRFSKEGHDPLAALVQAANELDRHLFIIPVFILYTQAPPRDTITLLDLLLGPPERPGRLRRTYQLLRNYKRAALRVGRVLDVDKFLEKKGSSVPYFAERMETIAYLLRKEALDRIATERLISLGPALRYRSEVIEAALRDQQTRRAIHEYIQDKDLSYGAGRRMVRGYLEEIAADQQSLTIRFMERVLNWFLNRSYAGLVVDQESLQRVREALGRGPVVYIPCHKSHMDYLLVSYVLYQNHLAIPYIAAGINLSFWPIGPLFRRAGAFFLRRSFRGAPLYSMAFAKYVEVLLKDGCNLEFFIEGGRSRTGKLGTPKLGFLSIILAAARQAGLKDLSFVPVMITYERVLEDVYYFREQSGTPNPPENLTSMLEGRGVLGRKQGKVYLDFGEVIGLQNFLAESGLKRLPTSREGQMKLGQELARAFVGEMNRISKVPPYSLVAGAILSTEKRGIYLADIRKRVEFLLGYLRARKIDFTENLGENFWPDPILAIMESEGLIKSDAGDRQDRMLYYVNEDKRLNLCYYKNAMVHHFQFPAMLAVALLREGPSSLAAIKKSYATIRNILRREFVYGHLSGQSQKPESEEVEAALELLIKMGYVQRLEDKVILLQPGEEMGRVLASLIASFLESYYLTFRVVRRMEDQPVPEKEIHRWALSMADRLFSTGEISRVESKNKLIFESALGYLEEEGVLTGEVQPVKGGKRFVRTYFLKNSDKLDKLLADLTPFIKALG